MYGLEEFHCSWKHSRETMFTMVHRFSEKHSQSVFLPVEVVRPRQVHFTETTCIRWQSNSEVRGVLSLSPSLSHSLSLPLSLSCCLLGFFTKVGLHMWVWVNIYERLRSWLNKWTKYYYMLTSPILITLHTERERVVKECAVHPPDPTNKLPLLLTVASVVFHSQDC